MAEERPEIITIPDALPVLPLRDTVLYPEMAVPILVGQPRSIELVNHALRGNRLAAGIAQKNAETVPAPPEELYRVGTVALLHELGRDDKTIRLAVQGIVRIRTIDYIQTEPYLVARVERARDVREHGVEVEAAVRKATELFGSLVRMAPELSDDLASVAERTSDPRQLAYFIAATVPLPMTTRQEVLELDAPSAKLRKLIEVLQHEITVRELIQRITSETALEMSKAQREHILRKHMESIQRELGELKSGTRGGTRAP
jgi:ATP-dependent Lon protease